MASGAAYGWLALSCLVAIAGVFFSSDAGLDLDLGVPSPTSPHHPAAVAAPPLGPRQLSGPRPKPAGPSWRELPGVDLKGRYYKSPAALWWAVDKALAEDDNSAGLLWYRASVQHWDSMEASDQGMVANFNVTEVDVRGSEEFLERVLGARMEEAAAGGPPLVVVDCGSGVGRITELLLLRRFQEVDLLEPSGHLLEKARERFSGGEALPSVPPSHRVVNYFKGGLQEFDPEPGRYDAMWMQWSLTYLTDADAVTTLRRCAAALRPGGLILVKDNLCVFEGIGFAVEQAHPCIVRSRDYQEELFTEGTGLKVVHTEIQRDWPADLMPMLQLALQKCSPDEPCGRVFAEE